MTACARGPPLRTTRPTHVADVRLADVEYVGAIGDSISTGFNARNQRPLDMLTSLGNLDGTHPRSCCDCGLHSRPREAGTLAIKKCLFDMPKEESGWYYGSDGVRSPLHFMRNPGEPAYDGVVPPEVLA